MTGERPGKRFCSKFACMNKPSQKPPKVHAAMLAKAAFASLALLIFAVSACVESSIVEEDDLNLPDFSAQIEGADFVPFFGDSIVAYAGPPALPVYDVVNLDLRRGANTSSSPDTLLAVVMRHSDDFSVIETVSLRLLVSGTGRYALGPEQGPNGNLLEYNRFETDGEQNVQTLYVSSLQGGGGTLDLSAYGTQEARATFAATLVNSEAASETRAVTEGSLLLDL